jgi:hypothetical protein
MGLGSAMGRRLEIALAICAAREVTTLAIRAAHEVTVSVFRSSTCQT